MDVVQNELKKEKKNIFISEIPLFYLLLEGNSKLRVHERIVQKKGKEKEKMKKKKRSQFKFQGNNLLLLHPH